MQHFTNIFKLSKTLRFELKLVGKTAENFANFTQTTTFQNDKKRFDAYPNAKSLIDEYHKNFIEDVLCDAEFEWQALADAVENFQKNKNEKSKTALEDEQKKMRKAVAEKFTKNNENYKKLFGKELFSELLPNLIKTFDNHEKKQNAEETVKIFDKFTTYFTGFHENRKNIYKEDGTTAIAHRVVNENFPKFLANIKLFEKLPDKLKNEAKNELKEFLNGAKLEDFFTLDSFNFFLTQGGIERYNAVLGGISEKAGSKKTKGLNETLNLAFQQGKIEKKFKFQPLFKQILSEREATSFAPTGFENQDELKDVVSKFKNENLDVALEQIRLNLQNIEIYDFYDFSKIFVPAKEQANFSKEIFGRWDAVRDAFLKKIETEKKKPLTETQADTEQRKIKKRDYSLSEIDGVLQKEETARSGDWFERISNFTKTKFDELFSRINFGENFQENKTAALPLKEFLDDVQKLYRLLKLLDYRGECETDGEFYAVLSEILQTLEPVVPLYNNARNFVTKKPGEVKKIKLNFENPTLACGWDANKEKDNHAVIFRKDGNYFLGIFNPKNKPKFDKTENAQGECYEKMVYKLLPGPNKMLPKVFFSNKWRDKFTVPEEIQQGYRDEKHKKGSSFDKKFLHSLIDWFKSQIAIHEDWKNFNFKFSDTRSYESIDEFYKEVETGGYKLTFSSVSVKQIDEFVNSGKLYLFQIYNKDFATNATGRKNLHTLYWEQLFSEENLQDTVLKLNGEAELFFRPKNENLRRISHAKNSFLVNRTTKNAKPIPENLYQEIYKFKNGFQSEISNEAKALLDSGEVICKKATHEIVKERRFHEDKFLFHCPITLNFRANESEKLNEKVCDYIKEKDGICIIGLDRGERHLLYLSLIDQNGKIKLQKTLNLVSQKRGDGEIKVDYHAKLAHIEGERDEARKNWQNIANIKELKEGYLSNVIHEIAHLMVKHNAIVVLEDLNFGFKRGRFKVEKQVYQKFEKMLIEKLNFLVFKEKVASECGGVLKAFQLTSKFESFAKLGKQCGFLFYTQAAYTSKIDPVTGFVNLFDTRYKSVEASREFFAKFDEIKFNAQNGYFEFVVSDYSKFNPKALKQSWKICTFGSRIENFKENEKWQSREVNLSDKFRELFDKFKTSDLKAEILAQTDATFFRQLLRLFGLTVQLRNSFVGSDVDYICSPVADKNGEFFDSRKELAKIENGEVAALPCDADANGAYNIARKGALILKKIKQAEAKDANLTISNAEWFEFINGNENGILPKNNTHK